MAMDGDISGGLSNAADNVPTDEATQFLYNGLYVYDAALTPIPDLADGEAEISEDGTEWTIKLREGVTFHDGTPLGADDVVQSYELALSPGCRYNPDLCTLANFLVSVEAVDDLTVKFTLNDTLATFASVYLPSILIDSKDAVDASYEEYLEKVGALTASDTGAFLDEVTAEEDSPSGEPDEDGNPTTNYAQFLTHPRTVSSTSS
jgi:ABC-type transport system substrate-binding protein